MLISHKLKCIFVHLTKTGGWAIENVLKKNDPGIVDVKHGVRGRHMLPRDLKEAAGEDFESDRYKDYFKFALVRNPWDRLVSTYFMCVQFPLNPEEYEAKKYSFDEFITKWIFKDMIVGINQHEYIYKDGKRIVDFVGYFEKKEEDFGKICGRLGIKGELSHINATKHKHYSAYYNEDTKRIVAERFKEDIETFGYKFEDTGGVRSLPFSLLRFADHNKRRLQSFVKGKFPKLYGSMKKAVSTFR